MKKHSIVFDADEVLIGCADFLLQCAKDLYGPAISVIKPAYRIDERFGLTSQQVDEVFDHFHHKMIHQPVIEGASTITHELKKDFNIYVVTAISPVSRDKRIKCLKSHDIYFDDVMAAGIHMSKRSFLESIRPVEFVDDRLVNLKDAHNLNIHRAWIEVNGEEHEIPGHGHFESKHSNLQEWYEDFKTRKLKQRI